MSDSASQNKPDKLLHTTFFGVSQVEQVLFKGYLRVLLRLDVTLVWLVERSNKLDLLVINEALCNTPCVQKLRFEHPSCPVLFIRRCKSGKGSLQDNKIVLPLNEAAELSALHSWLQSNLKVLHKDVAMTEIAALSS